MLTGPRAQWLIALAIVITTVANAAASSPVPSRKAEVVLPLLRKFVPDDPPDTRIIKEIDLSRAHTLDQIGNFGKTRQTS